METIKSFLFDLAKSKCLKEGYVYVTKIKNTSPEAVYILSVKNKDLVEKVLIPFFDSMIWHSKKQLDYSDWKFVFKIKQLGLHYTKPGEDLIGFILSRMNNNRLTISKEGIESMKTVRSFSPSEIDKIMSGPSNYERQEDGKILIKSSNKNSFTWKNIEVELRDPQGFIFKTFKSITNCEKFLGVSSHTITKRIKTNKSVFFNDREYYVKINE